ncbi:MAG TPA: hydantoinase/oxoprolinase family protein [Candidatus Deferrimicrobiaceae bacterium]|nr:hydantoinase/oxoprolinase family protein [Candidatus Deferrimicrobiaceae bacterium]
MYIVGIDVGGTFTDLTAVDAQSGRVVVTKVPSRPRHEAAAVLAGLEALGIASAEVRRLVHGTTVGTNAVLERRGARVALLTTAGFRDLIEIGRTKRNIPALFIPTFVRPKPVVERKHRFEVTERLGPDGGVLVPLDPASIEGALDGALAAGAEALAVCLLHAYLNPAHEHLVADAAKGRAPGLPVSCSADVVAEYREFERFSTTVLNAYLQPLMEGYLTSLEERLLATGYTHGVLTVASSGGMMTTDTARRLPIKTIFSGPAGGVSQACFVGAAAGIRDFITYDMGGTSTDVCLVRDLQPLMTADAMVGAFPVKVSQIDMHTVGAGGGSIAWLDVDGSLQVGPRSAGASPGPAAYGLGGTEPAVTDANVVLGRIGTRRRLGGSIAIDAERARQAVAALAARLERPLGVEPLAEGIVTIAVARMTSAIREISIQRGHDPRDFTLVAFGGAGPMHALAMAEEIGIPRVLVPRHPGNFSALGLLAADIKHDDVRTRVGLLGERLPALRLAFAEMETAARQQLEREGFAPPQQKLLRSLDLRYRGQAFELNIALADTRLALDRIEADFHRQHRATYGHANPEAAIELVNARLTAYGLVPKPAAERHAAPGAAIEAALVERRPVWFGGRAYDCPVWDRERLPEGARLAGPAIVEEFGATTVVPPGWRGAMDEHGNLRFERGTSA